MQLIRFDSLQASPWKNGGGVTREIAAEWQGKNLRWRLSIADVAVDGPFSNFAGLQRILTVVKGRGMELISPDQTLHADYAVPVHFDGGWHIHSRLKQGPIRDFNVIYDPGAYNAQVLVLNGPTPFNTERTANNFIALHCVDGLLTFDTGVQLQTGDTALLQTEFPQFAVQAMSTALIVTLQPAASS